jgi:rare lipoprotein A
MKDVVSVIHIARPGVLAAAPLLGPAGAVAGTLAPAETTGADATTHHAPAAPHAKPDLSGGTRAGKASFYATTFTGRTIAHGKRMDPHADNAASKTLPLGTTATVTDLGTGQSAHVTIEDRGPYVKGRIVDLSPTMAHEIGIVRRNGIATVVVAPIARGPDGLTRRRPGEAGS